MYSKSSKMIVSSIQAVFTYSFCPIWSKLQIEHRKAKMNFYDFLCYMLQHWQFQQLVGACIHQSSWLGFFRWMVNVFSPKWFWRDSAYLRLKFKNTKVQIVWNIKMYKNSLIFLTPIWGNINIVFGTTLILRLSAHQCECCNIELQPERATSISTQ
jgi:hypothetical protein